MGSSVWRIRDISVRNRIPFYSKSDPDPTIILSRIQIHSKHSTSYCPFMNIFIEALSNSMLQHLGRVRFNFILMLNHLARGSSPAPDPANQFKQNRKNFKTPELGARLQNNVASLAFCVIAYRISKISSHCFRVCNFRACPPLGFLLAL